jgi:prepilin-type N-terminal cleavage/methylation domain-containing protein
VYYVKSLSTGQFSPPRPLPKGFTFLEITLVIAIMGILLALSYPSLMNSLHTRSLESTAREIASDLQWAKLQAVKTKINHRLRFEQLASGAWTTSLELERETQPSTWEMMPKYVRRVISTNFNVTVSLPGNCVVYSSLGLVDNFSTLMNTVTVQSDKLKQQEQMDVREILVYAGGTVQYLRSRSAT